MIAAPAYFDAEEHLLAIERALVARQLSFFRMHTPSLAAIWGS